MCRHRPSCFFRTICTVPLSSSTLEYQTLYPTAQSSKSLFEPCATSAILFLDSCSPSTLSTSNLVTLICRCARAEAVFLTYIAIAIVTRLAADNHSKPTKTILGTYVMLYRCCVVMPGTSVKKAGGERVALLVDAVTSYNMRCASPDAYK
jgi:hypothetical protein